MNKLVKRFEEITYQYKSEGTILLVQIEEAKKLAIEFAKYIVKCKDLEGNIIGNNNNFIDNFGDLLFNKFIDEYYE